MLLYNVTIGIDKNAEAEWLSWIKVNHIPRIMQTGLFEQVRMFKVLQDDSEDTVSYSVQYFATSLELVVQYLEVFAPKIMEDHRITFLHKHVVFNTLLEEVAL